MGTTEEQSAYSKGYAAGKKRAVRDAIRENEWAHRQALREQFEREAFLVALPAIMAGTWTTGGEKVTTIDGYVSLAIKFARKASDQFSFPLPPLPAPPAPPKTEGVSP